ncbi:hypothetical protein ACFUCH_29835 [Streptomyces olivaceus]|uniref:hypothetical protein n=1 Tax=Streptomyces olivaceus TaxID=47716 RepID=UPI00362BAADE
MTSARLCGCVVAVISERWRLAENVTVSVFGSSCSVLTVKPWSGTAETRHTPSPPNRTVALPPSDGTVKAPAPPSSHAVGSPPPDDGCGRSVRALGVGVGLGSGGRSLVRAGAGLGRAGPVAGDGLGEGLAGPDEVGAGEAGSSGADCATGAVGRVEPRTKWIVRMTAVTLAAVHDSQMIR